MEDVFKVLLEHTIEFLFVCVMPVVWGLFSKWLKGKAQERGIKIAEFQWKALDDAAKEAWTYAEGIAAKNLKVDGVVSPGAEKMSQAIDFALERAKRAGLDSVTRDEIERLIESKLYQAKVAPVLAEAQKSEQTVSNADPEAPVGSGVKTGLT